MPNLTDDEYKEMIVLAYERWKKDPNDKSLIELVVGSMILDILEREGITA